MATESKPSSPPPFKFDAAAVTKKLDELEAYYMQFAGKPGYNPYTFIEKNVKSVRAALASPQAQTKELQERVLSLKQEEPIVLPENTVQKPPVKSATPPPTGENLGARGK